MFLGIDIGTSAVKVVLMSEDGQVASVASAPLNVSRPQLLWSQQDPDDWWRAVEAAVSGLPSGQLKRARAIGLSGQMHGATLLGDDHRPLRPAILWNDGRCAAECEALEANCPEFRSRGRNPVLPGFTAPKLEWVRRHEPDIFARTRKVLLPKDYVRLCMTGDFASDMSDSAGTLWMDVEQRDWWEPLLQACGLDRTHMPSLFEGPSVTGTLRREVAEAWGMDAVPVCAGGGDNAAGAIGVGVVEPGEAMLSLGTSGVIFAATDQCLSAPERTVHSFCHALPDRWHVMSVMLSAASCLDWAARVTRCEDVGALVALAEAHSDTAHTPTFLPYLSGERTPHNDPEACGVLHGISHDTGPSEIAQAVLEGVAFGLADGLDALTSAGLDVDALSVIGGGSRSNYWGRLIAAALGKTLLYRESSDTGPALGAARLAALSAGGKPVDEILCKPAIQAEVQPDPDLVEVCQARREPFSKLYQATKDIPQGGQIAR